MARAQAVAPAQGAVGIVQARFHCQIDIRDRCNTVKSRIGRFIRQHGDGTHDDQPRPVRDQADFDTRFLQ